MDDCLSAGGGSPVGRAGFKGDVERGVFGLISRSKLLDRIDLGVSVTCRVVPSASEDDVVLRDDGADAGIGGCESNPFLRFRER